MGSEDLTQSSFLKKSIEKDTYVKKVDESASVVDKSLLKEELIQKKDALVKESQLRKQFLENENLHSLTGDIKDSLIVKGKAIPEGLGKGFVNVSINSLDRLVADEYSEDAMSATEMLTGKQIREFIEETKNKKQQVMSPFTGVGKVARVPRHVGEVHATMFEHSSTRQAKRANKKLKKFYSTSVLTGGNESEAIKHLEKDKKKLEKANRQLGRSTAKLNKAKAIKNKKKPVAWLFDGRAKDAFLKLFVSMLPVLLILIILITMIMGMIVTSNNKNGSGYGDLEGNCLIICQFLRGKDVPDMAIAAICGNIYAESGYNNAAVESNGEGNGICQWSYGRKILLHNFAKSKGKDWTDLTVQLEFLWNELTTSYDLEGLKKQTSIESATKFFHDDFERSVSYESSREKRETEAKRVYEQLQSGGSYSGDNEAVKRAYQCIGIMYEWGGCSPTGMDCSGLVSYAIRGKYGHVWNTLTYMSWQEIPANQAQPGDVLVTSSHCGLYIGNGKMIHAPTFGQAVVETDVGWFVAQGAKYVRH